MKNMRELTLEDLSLGEVLNTPMGGHIEKNVLNDPYGSKINILSVSNGLLTYTVLPERGMDIGEILCKEEKISWEKDIKYLLHPNNVDLHDNNGTGWIKGFYGAVASIGPELFGTPGEGYTLHGTGSYSPALLQSIHIFISDAGITVEGAVQARGYGNVPVFEKEVRIKSMYGSPVLLREETVKNLSDTPKVLDDGYHLQLAGKYISEGGRYVLPAPVTELLLRDSAPEEADPLSINPVNHGTQPLRCYQYVPGQVQGLESIKDIAPYMRILAGKAGITAEMMVNNDKTTAAYVVRSLDCFPRSLIAKEVGENAMFALEPCRTRPNRMSQKITDGEAFFLQPHAFTKTSLLIGITKNPETMDKLEKIILKAAIRG